MKYLIYASLIVVLIMSAGSFTVEASYYETSNHKEARSADFGEGKEVRQDSRKDYSMKKLCYIQENCKWFTTGNNHPPNHHVRVTEKCILFDGVCAEQHDIKQGDACNIKKANRLRGKK